MSVLALGLVSFLAALSFLAFFWLLHHGRLIRTSAEVNCVLFEPVDIELETERTVARKIGNALRYLIYLLDLLFGALRKWIVTVYDKVAVLAGHKPRDRYWFPGFDRELWRRKRFFPSFEEWRYALGRRERELDRLPRAAGPGYVAPIESVHLVGTIRLPRRAYVDDTCVVELSLLPQLYYSSNRPAKLSVLKRSDEHVLIRAEWEGDSRALEIRLIGVGVDVKPIGPTIQSQESVFFSWGCAFPHSGLQTLVLSVALYFHHGSAQSQLKHTVKVVQVDHLTSRQVRVLGGIAAAIGVASTLLGILKALGVLMS
jgi:hypothetical protein